MRADVAAKLQLEKSLKWTMEIKFNLYFNAGAIQICTVIVVQILDFMLNELNLHSDKYCGFTKQVPYRTLIQIQIRLIHNPLKRSNLTQTTRVL